MSRPRLFRRRFIPDENIELKDDMILALEPNLIITSWNVLKPRMVYWYCDIIETHYDEKENIYTFNDLLIDVVVYPDGQVEVLDMDEFADAIEQGILSVGTIAHAMRATDDLLHTIYAGEFEKYTHYIDDMLKVIS